jgi:hypothetical protein
MREEYESRGDYLADVEEQLRRMSKNPGSDKITADFVMLDTRPKSILQKLRDTTAGD